MSAGWNFHLMTPLLKLKFFEKMRLYPAFINKNISEKFTDPFSKYENPDLQ